MSADLVGVLYSSISGVVRSTIIPVKGDGLEDAGLLAQQKAPPENCAIAIIQRKEVPDLRIRTLIDAVNARDGLSLAMPFPCAVVDKSGAVQGLLAADPEHTPTFNGKTIIKNDVGAAPGDKWDGKDFIRNYAVADAKTGKVLAVQALALPDLPPVTKDADGKPAQRIFVNNDDALKVDAIVGVSPA